MLSPVASEVPGNDFSPASFKFEVFLVAFSASFWKVFLVEVLPRKGHPGDADDASYSLDFCRGRRLRAAEGGE